MSGHWLDPEIYFVDRDGSIRRFDVREAGGRKAHRKLKRLKRRRRIAQLKGVRVAGTIRA